MSGRAHPMPAPSRARARRVEALRNEGLALLSSFSGRDDVVSFAGGVPCAEALGALDLAPLVELALAQPGHRALSYGGGAGEPELRAVAATLMCRQGVQTDADEILVTSGSQQGLDLVARVLLDPGDVVAVPAPTYLGALVSLRAYEPRLVAVASDAAGLVPEDLRRVVQRTPTPKLLYLVPTFDNPTGTLLPAERRTAIVEICERAGVTIVEDDPYGQLHFDAPPPAPLAAAHDAVIYLGSFSKVVAPGLRVGWARVPRDLLADFRYAKEAADLCTSPLLQLVTAAFAQSPMFEGHLTALRGFYRARRDALLAALEQDFRGRATWTAPAGGFFVWVKLSDGTDVEQLLSRALAQGVAFVPGTTFYLDHRASSCLRLSYSNPTAAAIQTGVARLRRALASPLEEVGDGR